MTQPHSMTPPAGPSGRAAAIAGAAAILACVLGGASIRHFAGNDALPIDLAWYDFSNDIHSPALDGASRFLNVAGAQNVVGFVIPVLAAVVFALLRRAWAAVAVLLCGIASAPLVDGIKSVLQRPRPGDQLISVSLTAYPSGHVANLAATVVVLALLVGSTWFWIVATVLVIAMAFSRTYLNVHWITDDVGGLLLGAGIALLVWGALLSRIRSEYPSKLRTPARGQSSVEITR